MSIDTVATGIMCDIKSYISTYIYNFSSKPDKVKSASKSVQQELGFIDVR